MRPTAMQQWAAALASALHPPVRFETSAQERLMNPYCGNFHPRSILSVGAKNHAALAYVPFIRMRDLIQSGSELLLK